MQITQHGLHASMFHVTSWRTCIHRAIANSLPESRYFRRCCVNMFQQNNTNSDQGGQGKSPVFRCFQDNRSSTKIPPLLWRFQVATMMTSVDGGMSQLEIVPTIIVFIVFPHQARALDLIKPFSSPLPPPSPQLPPISVGTVGPQWALPDLRRC